MSSQTDRKQKNKASQPTRKTVQEVAERSPIRPCSVGINFSEAEGRVVAYINYYSRQEVYQAVEIRFTDGTFLEFELRPVVLVTSAFNQSINGDIACIRNYGVLPDEP